MTDIQLLQRSQLKLSQTKSQGERRDHYDKSAIAELADSLAKVGMLQPIVARPVNGHFEIVAGERRYLAAGKAGLEIVPVNVRELTDEEVLEVQLVENLQREGLHELAEAEGYEALMKNHGYTSDDVVAKVGKSRSYVYGRMKLLDLTKESRRAFYDGKINASVALLLARIPVPKTQGEALKHIMTGDDGEPMSFRAAKELIGDKYMLLLSEASFDATVDNLVPGALACGKCPKNTLAQPDLFSDVKSGSAGVCTDPGCFAAKTKRTIEIRIKSAKESGTPVLEGNKAKEVFPYSSHTAYGGYSRLDSTIYVGGKEIKVKSLVGKDVTPTLVRVKDRHEDEEKLIEVVDEKTIKAALKDKGVKTTSPPNSAETAARKRQQVQAKYRSELYTQIREKLPSKLDQSDLRYVAAVLFDRLQQATQVKVCGLWEWEATKTSDGGWTRNSFSKTAELKIPKLKDAELTKFIFDCVFADELHSGTYDTSKPERMLETAKRLRIDADKILKECQDAGKAKASTKKKVKKK